MDTNADEGIPVQMKGYLQKCRGICVIEDISVEMKGYLWK